MPERSFAFEQVDVFTNEVLRGNQLAVFLQADGLSNEEMQLIAREMNLPETTFILPATRPDCAVRVRIFTPGREMPFAGHPTIGTAYVLARQDLLPAGATEIHLEEGVGPIRVRLEGDPRSPDRLWMRHTPVTLGPPLDGRDDFARAVGLTASDLIPEVPILVGSGGNPFLYIALRDPATVDRAVSDPSAVTRCCTQTGAIGFFLVAPKPEAGDRQVHSRMFAPLLGIPEDPATGSASGALGVYLVKTGLVPADDPVVLVSEQGTFMGRQSFIHIRLRWERGEAGEIEIGGSAVAVLSGTLTL